MRAAAVYSIRCSPWRDGSLEVYASGGLGMSIALIRRPGMAQGGTVCPMQEHLVTAKTCRK
jgi:hypothetical protein